MLKRLKSYFQRFRAQTSLSDKLQLLSFIAGIVALFFVYLQLRENTHTNKFSIRGQLYQSEAGMAAEEAGDEKQHLTTIWALVPPTVKDQEFATTLVKIVSDDSCAQNAKTAEELYISMFDATTFADPKRRESTNQLRRLFLYTQTNLYHVHNAHDYWKEGVIADPEWTTWKNIIREMNAHPMLITVIWQGHRNQYFSRSFGRFLQQELCADSIPPDHADPEVYKRGKEFIRFYYPNMLKKEWLAALPDY
jgi:hypothetical protein